jgi:hypothetical protein
LIELLRTENPVLLSAVIAALEDDGIEAITFDGLVSNIYGGVFPQRLMVLEEDLIAARRIVASICPEHLPQISAD